MWGLEALWNRQPAWLKQLIVLVGLVVVALLDHRSSATLPVSHLYYLPILLAALSFGYVGGYCRPGQPSGSITSRISSPAERLKALTRRISCASRSLSSSGWSPLSWRTSTAESRDWRVR